MTDEVAELVLDDNRAQTLALVDRPPPGAADGQRARPLPRRARGRGLARPRARVPADRQADRRAPVGRRRAARRPSSPCCIAYTKNANVAEIVRTDLPDDPSSRPTSSRYFPTPLRERFADADPRPPAAPGDHRHAARQPDGQPVGHLVRPPDDRGHRRVGGRRDPGVGRRPRRLRLRRAVGRDRRARPARSRSTPSSTCSSTAGGWSSAARCGCCATAGRRSTSPRPSPSSGPASPSSLRRPGAGARRAAWPTSCTRGEASRLAAGVPEDLAERAGVWPLLHTGVRPVELAERARARRRRAWPPCTGSCSTAST